MTTEQANDIFVLKSNIRNAEDKAQRALEQGNEVGHRIHTDFAEECRAELRAVLAVIEQTA